MGLPRGSNCWIPQSPPPPNREDTPNPPTLEEMGFPHWTVVDVSRLGLERIGRTDAQRLTVERTQEISGLWSDVEWIAHLAIAADDLGKSTLETCYELFGIDRNRWPGDLTSRPYVMNFIEAVHISIAPDPPALELPQDEDEPEVTIEILVIPQDE